MSIDEKLAVPFYRVGLERLTFTEILERFVDPSKKSGNFHRISDMHVKIGMPISFRTDDELIAIEKVDTILLQCDSESAKLAYCYPWVLKRLILIFANAQIGIRPQVGDGLVTGKLVTKSL